GWDVMNRRMNELLGPAMGVVSEFWDHFDPDNGPFGQNLRKFLDFASSLFDRRMKVLERDRGKALAEIERATPADIGAEAEPVASIGARPPVLALITGRRGNGSRIGELPWAGARAPP